MSGRLKISYLFTGVLFLVVAYAGCRYRQWGFEELAFLLLVYLVVAIGIRIDALHAQLVEIQEQIASFRDR